MSRIPVAVNAGDEIVRAGLATHLRQRPDVLVVEEHHPTAVVTLIVVESVDEQAVRSIRAARDEGLRSVVVAGHLDEEGLLAAIEAGACGFVRRSAATPEVLADAVRRAADGDGEVPPDLLGRLLEQIGQLQRTVLGPRGLQFSGLTDREVDVLRLLADGRDTTEVADALAYSVRTVKNVVHDITTRFNLRNRTHAVAFALRQGLI